MVYDYVPITTVDILGSARLGLTQEFLTLGSWIEFKEERKKYIYIYFFTNLYLKFGIFSMMNVGNGATVVVLVPTTVTSEITDTFISC